MENEEEEEDEPEDQMRARKRYLEDGSSSTNQMQPDEHRGDEGWMPIAEHTASSGVRQTENGDDAEGDAIEDGPITKTQYDAQKRRDETISTNQKQKDVPGKSSTKRPPRRGPGSATSSTHHDEEGHPYYDFNGMNGTEWEWDPREDMTATSSNMQQFVFGPKGQGVFVRDINKKIP